MIRIGGKSWVSKLVSIIGILLLLVFAVSSIWSWVGSRGIACPPEYSPNFSVFNWVLQGGTDLNRDGWLCQQLESRDFDGNEVYNYLDNIK